MRNSDDAQGDDHGDNDDDYGDGDDGDDDGDDEEEELVGNSQVPEAGRSPKQG